MLLLTSCKIYKTFPTANNNILGLKAPKFRGSIFKDTYPFEYLLVSEVDSFNRFTPSVGEIREAENILKRDMKAINKGKLNQQKHYPDISNNSNKYFRQYVGFINHKGEKLIHFNCHWDRYTLWDRLKAYDDDRLSFDSDYTITLDGGSRYWQTLINLDQKKVIGWSVNGIAFVTGSKY
jgi:hypothetical protein